MSRSGGTRGGKEGDVHTIRQEGMVAENCFAICREPIAYRDMGAQIEA